MKALLNLIRFPFLFLYFVGGAIAGGLGLKENRVVPVAFVGVVVLGMFFGVRALVVKPETVPVMEGENPGHYFIPAETEDSIIRVTMLESALGHFFERHGRSPKNYAELRKANIIRDLPVAKEGFEFQIDFETPAILEVPKGTPPPRHPDEPEPVE